MAAGPPLCFSFLPIIREGVPDDKTRAGNSYTGNPTLAMETLVFRSNTAEIVVATTAPKETRLPLPGSSLSSGPDQVTPSSLVIEREALVLLGFSSRVIRRFFLLEKHQLRKHTFS